MLKQRLTGMDSNLELAAGEFVYIIGKLLNIDSVKLALWVGCRHVPFCLCNSTK